jgi:RimJ/RimL family protein N-acetyltransferase
MDLLLDAKMQIGRADKLGADETERLIEFIVEWGHVPNRDYVKTGVENALAIARLFINDNLVGVAAIKRPNAKYKKRSFDKASSSRNATEFDFELGYIVVERAYERKGIGTTLAKLLLNTVPDPSRAFATVRENNSASCKLLSRCQFVCEGKSYPNENGEYQLKLFVGSAIKKSE